MPCTRCRRHLFVGSDTPCSCARAAAGHIFERVEETWNAGDVQAQSEVYAADPGYVKRHGMLHLGREKDRANPQLQPGVNRLQVIRPQVVCRSSEFLARNRRR